MHRQISKEQMIWMCPGLHYQSLCLRVQSLNFLRRAELKKKKGKEGGKTREQQLVALAFHQQRGCLFASGSSQRGGHSLHPHTARLSLPLSLSISRSVCLCLSLSLPETGLKHFFTPPMPVTPFSSILDYFLLSSLRHSVWHCRLSGYHSCR